MGDSDDCVSTGHCSRGLRLVSSDDDDDDDAEESSCSESDDSGSDVCSGDRVRVPVGPDMSPAGSSRSGSAPSSGSSDSESAEVCAICLSSFRGQPIGNPESCDHNFCLDHILEWAKNVSTCPVDRQPFTMVLVRDVPGGKITRRLTIEEKDTLVEPDDDPTYCEVCGRCDREDRLLLCDGCDSGYHLDCLQPPLQRVPEDQWFCTECAPDAASAATATMAAEMGLSQQQLASLLHGADGSGATEPTVSRPRLARTRLAERIRARVPARQIVPTTRSGGTARTRGSRSSSSRGASTRRRRRRQTATGSRARAAKSSSRKKRATKKSGRRKSRRKTTARSARSSCRSASEQDATRQHLRRLLAIRRLKPGQRAPPAIGSLGTDDRGAGFGSRWTAPGGWRRGQAGLPSLSLFGRRDDLAPGASDSDPLSDDDESAGARAFRCVPGSGAGPLAGLVQCAGAGPRWAPAKSRLAPAAAVGRVDSVTNSVDVLSQILNSQTVLLSRSRQLRIERDGRIALASPPSPPAAAAAAAPSTRASTAPCDAGPSTVPASSSTSSSASVPLHHHSRSASASSCSPPAADGGGGGGAHTGAASLCAASAHTGGVGGGAADGGPPRATVSPCSPVPISRSNGAKPVTTPRQQQQRCHRSNGSTRSVSPQSPSSGSDSGCQHHHHQHQQQLAYAEYYANRRAASSPRADDPPPPAASVGAAAAAVERVGVERGSPVDGASIGTAGAGGGPGGGGPIVAGGGGGSRDVNSSVTAAAHHDDDDIDLYSDIEPPASATSSRDEFVDEFDELDTDGPHVSGAVSAAAVTASAEPVVSSLSTAGRGSGCGQSVLYASDVSSDEELVIDVSACHRSPTPPPSPPLALSPPASLANGQRAPAAGATAPLTESISSPETFHDDETTRVVRRWQRPATATASASATLLDTEQISESEQPNDFDDGIEEGEIPSTCPRLSRTHSLTALAHQTPVQPVPAPAARNTKPVPCTATAADCAARDGDYEEGEISPVPPAHPGDQWRGQDGGCRAAADRQSAGDRCHTASSGVAADDGTDDDEGVIDEEGGSPQLHSRHSPPTASTSCRQQQSGGRQETLVAVSTNRHQDDQDDDAPAVDEQIVDFVIGEKTHSSLAGAAADGGAAEQGSGAASISWKKVTPGARSRNYRDCSALTTGSGSSARLHQLQQLEQQLPVNDVRHLIDSRRQRRQVRSRSHSSCDHSGSRSRHSRERRHQQQQQRGRHSSSDSASDGPASARRRHHHHRHHRHGERDDQRARAGAARPRARDSSPSNSASSGKRAHGRSTSSRSRRPAELPASAGVGGGGGGGGASGRGHLSPKRRRVWLSPIDTVPLAATAASGDLPGGDWPAASPTTATTIGPLHHHQQQQEQSCHPPADSAPSCANSRPARDSRRKSSRAAVVESCSKAVVADGDNLVVSVQFAPKNRAKDGKHKTAKRAVTPTLPTPAVTQQSPPAPHAPPPPPEPEPVTTQDEIIVLAVAPVTTSVSATPALTTTTTTTTVSLSSPDVTPLSAPTPSAGAQQSGRKTASLEPSSRSGRRCRRRRRSRSSSSSSSSSRSSGPATGWRRRRIGGNSGALRRPRALSPVDIDVIEVPASDHEPIVISDGRGSSSSDDDVCQASPPPVASAAASTAISTATTTSHSFSVGGGGPHTPPEPVWSQVPATLASSVEPRVPVISPTVSRASVTAPTVSQVSSNPSTMSRVLLNPFTVSRVSSNPSPLARVSLGATAKSPAAESPVVKFTLTGRAVSSALLPRVNPLFSSAAGADPDESPPTTSPPPPPPAAAAATAGPPAPTAVATATARGPSTPPEPESGAAPADQTYDPFEPTRSPTGGAAAATLAQSDSQLSAAPAAAAAVISAAAAGATVSHQPLTASPAAVHTSDPPAASTADSCSPDVSVGLFADLPPPTASVPPPSGPAVRSTPPSMPPALPSVAPPLCFTLPDTTRPPPALLVLPAADGPARSLNGHSPPVSPSGASDGGGDSTAADMELASVASSAGAASSVDSPDSRDADNLFEPPLTMADSPQAPPSPPPQPATSGPPPASGSSGQPRPGRARPGSSGFDSLFGTSVVRTVTTTSAVTATATASTATTAAAGRGGGEKSSRGVHTSSSTSSGPGHTGTRRAGHQRARAAAAATAASAGAVSSTARLATAAARKTASQHLNKLIAGGVISDNRVPACDDVPDSAADMMVKDKYLKKLNRQERVVEEVKLVLKPFYHKRTVTKNQYKEILRKAVPKICHSKSGEINPNKIQALVVSYVRKYKHMNRKGGAARSERAKTGSTN